MNVTKILLLESDNTPKGKAIVVFQVDANFYYLKSLVKVEGYRTPFSSIDEIGVYLDMKLTILREVLPTTTDH